MTHDRIFHYVLFNSAEFLYFLFLQCLLLCNCETLVYQHGHSVLASSFSSTVWYFLLDQLLHLLITWCPKPYAPLSCSSSNLFELEILLCVESYTNFPILLPNLGVKLLAQSCQPSPLNASTGQASSLPSAQALEFAPII